MLACGRNLHSPSFFGNVKAWGMKEFSLCDPSKNLILFAEGIPEEEISTKQGA